jgi:hypothetical protein
MADDDWDSVPIALNVKKPVVVDEDDERVELEEVTTKESSKPKNAVDEKSALAKANQKSKAKQREREEELARELERARNAKPMTREEQAAEALRLRRLVEEADNELTKDLFGGVRNSSEPTLSASAVEAKSRDGVQDAESLIALMASVQLDTPRQNQELAIAVSKRLDGTLKRNAVMFLKELLRAATASLNDEEVNDLVGTLNVIKNDKVKAKLAKKKTPAAAVPKPKLNTLGLDKAGGDRYDMGDADERGAGGGRRGAYDDDDFM